jgi:hypothetical protein
MGNIVQGDNGTVLGLTIKDNGIVVDLTGATVDIAIKRGNSMNIKPATVTNALAGKCEVELTSEDVESPGLYFFQATVRFGFGLEFSSDIQRFKVGGKLTGIAAETTGVQLDGGEF